MKSNQLILVALVIAASVPEAALAGPPAGGLGSGEARFGEARSGETRSGETQFGEARFGGPAGERGRPGRHFLPPADYLDLTEEQTAAAEAIREEVRGQAETIREVTGTLREQLAAAFEEAEPDATQVGQLVIEMRAQKEQIRGLREEAESQFVALLDAEQFAKWENFQELRETRRERREGRRGGRFGGGFRERAE